MTNQVSPIQYTHQIVASAKQKFIGIVDDINTFKKEANFAMQAFQSNDYMVKCANQNPESLMNAIVNIASLRTTLNPAEKKAYLVPYGGKKPRVDLQISYVGLIDLAIKDGAILWAQSKIVRQNDDFYLTGVDTAPEHRYSPFASEKDRGNIIGVYCVAKFPNGDYLTEVMSVDEVNAIMKRSQSVKSGTSSPWSTDFAEMARKTVVKRASKYWKGSSALSNAIHYLNTDGNEGIIIDQKESNKTPQTKKTVSDVLSHNDPKKTIDTVNQETGEIIDIDDINDSDLDTAYDEAFEEGK